MNADQFQGKWKQMKGTVKERWGKLTDDDIDIINGRNDQLVGKIQEKYGIAKEEAQKRVDDWAKQQREQEAHMGKPAGSEGNLADREARHATKR